MTLIKETKKVKARNALHPGYSKCSRCGGNWGWKEYTSHMTDKTSGLFLFCVDCDKVVTKKERWKALDEWKKKCLAEVMGGHSSLEKLMEYISGIENTEFIEYPREKKEVILGGPNHS